MPEPATPASGRLAGVLTTVQAPTGAVRRLAERLAEHGASLFVAGDRKGPACYDVPGALLLDIEGQRRSRWELGRLLPEGHYARKNLAYLEAIASGATCLYETDDDNAPTDTWQPRSLRVRARRVAGADWVNAYAAFTREPAWPRGFPLELVRAKGCRPALDGHVEVDAPVQQGLADGSPDVDAVWRLICADELRFERSESLYLPPGACCPFNTQSTWWWSEAFPLLYVPSHCSFRACDIWRGFVALRCLWARGRGLVFHSSEVEQERNEHDLLLDLEQEVSGYLGNRRLVDTLRSLELDPSAEIGAHLLACHEALVAAGFLPEAELALGHAWLRDLERAARTAGA